MGKIAVVQHPPVLLDRVATLDRAVELTAEAAGQGAQLVVFPETWVPGYPAWIWRLRPGGDIELAGELHERLFAESVDLEAGDLDPLRQAAREHGLHVLCGINERDAKLSRTTLYNSYVHIGPNGDLLNRHRKLMPTNPERMVWGFGDATGLRVVPSPVGRVGSLLCWENFMPLARFALYAQGVELYVAPTWDSGDGWLGTMQHIAREGRCWVIGASTSLQAGEIPEDLPGRAQLYPDPDEWVNQGDSVVVRPGGQIVAGPLRKEHGMLVIDVDPARVAAGRRSLDVAGHYARPDIFKLTVDNRPQSALNLATEDDR